MQQDKENQEAFVELLWKLSKGNPGALSVCEQVAKCGNAQTATTVLAALLAQDCVGPKIWMRYKDECGEDVEKFMVLTVTQGMMLHDRG